MSLKAEVKFLLKNLRFLSLKGDEETEKPQIARA